MLVAVRTCPSTKQNTGIMVESQQNRSLAYSKCEDDIKLRLNNKYTWQQVAEKNNENEAWIIVRDKVYDVTGM